MTFEPDAKLPVQGSLSRVNALDLNAERVWTYQHTIDLGQHPRFALSGTWIRLSACALIIGVSSAAAYTTQWHGAANPPAARPSIHTASLHGGVKPTGLMAAIDSSPARGASTSPFPWRLWSLFHFQNRRTTLTTKLPLHAPINQLPRSRDLLISRYSRNVVQNVKGEITKP